MTRVLALDLSLTSTGVATPDGEATTIPTGDLRGPQRLSYIRDEVLHLEHDLAVDLVALENYAYGRANQAHQVGELGGVVRCALYDAGIPYVVVPPSTVKRYATGAGNANKMAMVIAARERLGYGGQQEDEADALWVRAVVAEAAGVPVVSIPYSHRQVVDATGSGKKKHASLREQVDVALGRSTDAA